jgi:hypothetical protein
VSGTQGLLGYLHQAGSLSARQLDYLRQRGFLPAEPATSHGQTDWYDYGIDETDEDDATEQLGAAGRKRGRGRRGSRGGDLKAEVLGEQLAEVLAARAAVLAPIGPLARRPGEVAVVLREALRRLRRLTSEELAEILRAALAGPLTVEHLWAFLALDEVRAVGRGAPGRAPQALRALVKAAAAGEEESALKHAWLRREEAVATVCDLLAAQGRLLEAAGLVHASDPELLRQGLRRHPHALAFWVLVLLFNVDLAAGKRSNLGGPPAVVSSRPGPALWARAWEQALRMDGARVVPFFALFHSANPTTEPMPLYCPLSWASLACRFSS